MLALYYLDPPADDWLPESEHLRRSEAWLVEAMGLTGRQAAEITAKFTSAGWACGELAIHDDGTTAYTRPRVMDRHAW